MPVFSQGEEGISLSSSDKDLLKHAPRFLFSIPDPLSNQKGKTTFDQPMGVAVDEATGNIFVADASSAISIFDSSGNFINKYGSRGTGPGQFNNPVDLHINQTQRLLYVLDQKNRRVQSFEIIDGLIKEKVEDKKSGDKKNIKQKIKKAKNAGNKAIVPKLIIPLPEGTFSQLGESAIIKRKGKDIHVNSIAVVTDSFGKIIVLNGGAHRVLIYSKDGEFLTQFGKGGSGDVNFNFPADIDQAEVEYVDEKGRKRKRIQYYIADTLNRRVQAVTEKGEFLFNIGNGYSKKADFSGPAGIAVDASQNIYVLDRLLAECLIFDKKGNFILAFGQEGDLYEKLYLTMHIAVSSVTKRIYICDMGNNRVMVYQLGSLEPVNEDNND